MDILDKPRPDVAPYLGVARSLSGRGWRERIAGLGVSDHALRELTQKLALMEVAEADIIEHQELLDILGVSANFILTNDNKEGYLHTRINKAFLKEQVTNFQQPFYICGPDQMVAELNDTLKELGASPEALVFEK